MDDMSAFNVTDINIINEILYKLSRYPKKRFKSMNGIVSNIFATMHLIERNFI